MVPLVAVERDDVAAIVFLAATGIPGASIAREQAVSLGRAEGAGEMAVRVRQVVTSTVVTVVELSGLTHLFQACESGALSEFISIAETFNPIVLKTIEKWVAKRLRK